jgi:poly(A) polymerase
MCEKSLIQILDALNHDDIHARMVGGCIRNMYLGQPVTDIDIACDFTPDITIEILQNKGIRVIPTGIKHGTVTAHIEGRNFEITTLRRDISSDGRHAQVQFSNDWIEDARRRDFTINALYADRDGSIYDPIESGFQDLENKFVRFIGDPTQRIQEDYLRILRFFRFVSAYHKGPVDKESYDACIALSQGLLQLSSERIIDEMSKLLLLHNPINGLKLMTEGGILDFNIEDVETVSRLIETQNLLNLDNLNSRFYFLKNLKKYINNNNIKLFFNKLDYFINDWSGDILKALYHYDRNVVIQGLLILKSKSNSIDDFVISQAMNLKVPLFPVVASDVMDKFHLTEGPKVGEYLKQAEKIWIESGFIISRDQIFDALKN